ncbi:MAG: hypothetical protein ABSE43_01640 [Steroidobacteraceae bacterium]
MNPSTYIVRLWRQSDQDTLAGQVEASDGALSARFATPSELAAILHAPSIHLRPRAVPQAPPADVIKLYRQVAVRR